MQEIERAAVKQKDLAKCHQFSFSSFQAHSTPLAISFSLSSSHSLNLKSPSIKMKHIQNVVFNMHF